LINIGTQKFAEYPKDIGEFMANMIQPRAEAGDVIMFTGVMQHCAMPNKSDKSRTGILIQMLPKVTNT
jgi:ectoine hydroxylase-related dioxygenase (phytanoyl-CoA dioxygenase family)